MTQMTVQAPVAMAIRYQRYTSADYNTPLMDRLIACYQNVFADEPWHEWYTCSVCSAQWGRKDSQRLSDWGFQHCGVAMKEFWPYDQVRSDLNDQIGAHTSCWLAMEGDEVIGFTWGYPMTVEALEEELGLTLDPPAHLRETLQPGCRVAYQDELGVVRRWRGRGIAKELVKRRLTDFDQQDVAMGVIRTRQTPEPSPTFLWYTRIGYEIVAQYQHTDGRVVLARSLTDLSDVL